MLNRDWEQSAQLSIQELTATDGAITVVDLSMAEQGPPETLAGPLLTIGPASVVFLYQAKQLV